MYRLIVESLLGLKLEGDRLSFRPCIPDDWDTFIIHYRFRETIYHIRAGRIPSGDDEMTVLLDGVMQPHTFIQLTDDHKEHSVEIKTGRQK
jgi:cellobiose phosphorylase